MAGTVSRLLALAGITFASAKSIKKSIRCYASPDTFQVMNVRVEITHRGATLRKANRREDDMIVKKVELYDDDKDKYRQLKMKGVFDPQDLGNFCIADGRLSLRKRDGECVSVRFKEFTPEFQRRVESLFHQAVCPQLSQAKNFGKSSGPPLSAFTLKEPEATRAKTVNSSPGTVGSSRPSSVAPSRRSSISNLFGGSRSSLRSSISSLFGRSRPSGRPSVFSAFNGSQSSRRSSVSSAWSGMTGGKRDLQHDVANMGATSERERSDSTLTQRKPIMKNATPEELNTANQVLESLESYLESQSKLSERHRAGSTTSLSARPSRGDLQSEFPQKKRLAKAQVAGGGNVHLAPGKGSGSSEELSGPLQQMAQELDKLTESINENLAVDASGPKGSLSGQIKQQRDMLVKGAREGQPEAPSTPQGPPPVAAKPQGPPVAPKPKGPPIAPKPKRSSLRSAIPKGP